ncbi:TLC domain-containing protein 3A isoform X1 [Leopardus geoffroyi]|uniref:TLC domain-containing protein 3A isoform X1 n=1 Tax=Leopardus geoffroyi TaxID=46844 RepID=UPI001E2607BD|nr:TLC domain-containing protein 3A isoform X1 [Leopardus geoffroyi]
MQQRQDVEKPCLACREIFSLRLLFGRESAWKISRAGRWPQAHRSSPSFLQREMPRPGGLPNPGGGGGVSTEGTFIPGFLVASPSPHPLPGAREQRRTEGRCEAFRRSRRPGREGDASAVTEQKPREPRPFPPLPGPRGRSGGGGERSTPPVRGAASATSELTGPQLARRPGEPGGSLRAQGRRRGDPAPAGRPAPIAAAGLVTRGVAPRARGQRPAAAGVAAGRGRGRAGGGGGGGGGRRVETGAGGPRQSGAAPSRPEPRRDAERGDRPPSTHAADAGLRLALLPGALRTVHLGAAPRAARLDRQRLRDDQHQTGFFSAGCVGHRVGDRHHPLL